jgi:hypothetical protein
MSTRSRSALRRTRYDEDAKMRLGEVRPMGHDGDPWFALMFIVFVAINEIKRRPGDFLWIWIIASMLGYLAFEYMRAAIRQRRRLNDEE